MRVCRKLELSSIACAVTALLTTAACAQDSAADYPSRNITIVVPYPPGGAPDVIVRIIGQPLSEILGKPIVVENRPGASTTIAAGSVARATPDGYTLLATDIAQTVAPSTIAALKFDPLKDLKPIAITAKGEFTLAISPALPPKSMKELVDYSKQNPEAIKAGHSGVGTPPHLFALSMIQATEMRALLVPYRGIALAIADVVAGHIQMTASVPGATAPLARDGKLRVLAVTSEQRLASLPDTPTVKELGLAPKGFDQGNWFGLTAPAGTPDAIIAKLNAAVNKAIVNAEAKEKLAKLDVRVVGGTPEALGQLMAQQVVSWRELLTGAGIKPE